MTVARRAFLTLFTVSLLSALLFPFLAGWSAGQLPIEDSSFTQGSDTPSRGKRWDADLPQPGPEGSLDQIRSLPILSPGGIVATQFPMPQPDDNNRDRQWAVIDQALADLGHPELLATLKETLEFRGYEKLYSGGGVNAAMYEITPISILSSRIHDGQLNRRRSTSIWQVLFFWCQRVFHSSSQ